MENVNTIELNGQLYDIEDATARTTAEQNSKELVKVKETANNAQTTATTAQTSANTALTSADEAKTIATTAQTDANEAKERASSKQQLFWKWLILAPDEDNKITITVNDIATIFRQPKDTLNENNIYYFVFGAEGSETQSEIHLAVQLNPDTFVARMGAWSVKDFSITQAGSDTLVVHWEKDTFIRAVLMPMSMGKL